MDHNFSPQQLKRLQLYFIEIEGTNLSKLNSKHRLVMPFKLSSQPLQNTVLKRLVTENIKIFAKQPNSNLFAYSYMLLVTIYNDSLDENLLNLIKSLLFDPSLILTQIYNAPFPNISSDELKKVIVEFIFQLQFTDYSKSLHKNIEKYPIVLYLFAIFLRAILAKYGLTSALNFQLEVSTETGFELLNELMDINYRNVNDSYLFLESQTVIIQLQPSLIALGKYQQSSHQSQNTIKYEVNRNQFEKINNNFMFESNIRESQYIDSDTPTPCFNWNSQQKNHMRQSNRVQGKGTLTILKQNASVSIMKHSPNIIEDHQCSVKSSQIDQSLQQNFYLLKNEDYGWKSPIFNNGIVMDDVTNAFDLFQMANKQKFTGKVISEVDQFPKNLDIDENSNQNSIQECYCKKQLRKSLKLCSKVYQVNHFTVHFKSYIQRNNFIYDSMIISMKNIFSSSQSKKKQLNKLDLSQQQGKNIRSKTFHEVINHSFSDFDQSLQDFQNRICFKLAKTGHASINSSQFQSKSTSKACLILDDKNFVNKLPKINFTYSNKSFIDQNVNKA